MNKIIPAILTNDINELKEKLSQLKGIVKAVQIDFIDGKFVNNKTIGIDEFNNITTTLELEAHLMVNNPEKYFEKCQQYNFNKVAFHIESEKKLNKTIQIFKEYDFKKGLAINPESDISKIKHYLDQIDYVLIMGVNPGFGGQELIETTFDKIVQIRNVAPEINIEVDGGINDSNIKKLKEAGADSYAIGGSIFKQGNLKENILNLEKIVNE